MESRRAHAIAIEVQSAQPALGADPWGALDLERAIASLPESARVVFVLRQLEGHSHEEIASLLGISSGAARFRYLRALRQFRALLEPP